MSAVTVGPQWGMSWVYDGFGNRTAQNVVKGSVPVQSVSVDMNTNRITTWGYDANGNATSIPGVGTITYDGSNRVKTVGSETYEYDPSNKRIWKNDTYTFWGARGERVGTYSVQLMQYLPEGQQTQVYQLSFVKGTEDWYFGGRRLQMQDRLGSVPQNWDVYAIRNNYYPYGEERSATASPADKFATYHRDGTGLDYADQRYYHAGSGRFLTSDPYGGSAVAKFPGSWNRYGYVSGDPVNKVDPSGLVAWVCVTTTGEDESTSGECQQIGGSTGGSGGSGRAPTRQETLMAELGVNEACANGLVSKGLALPSDARAALKRANDNKDVMTAAAAANGLGYDGWRIMAAMGIRESNFQNIAQQPRGPGRGIWQIEPEQHNITEAQAYDITFAANHLASYLAGSIALFSSHLAARDMDYGTLVGAAIRSWNAGRGGTLGLINSRYRRGLSVDFSDLNTGTANGNYVGNVADLMNCF